MQLNKADQLESQNFHRKILKQFYVRKKKNTIKQRFITLCRIGKGSQVDGKMIEVILVTRGHVPTKNTKRLLCVCTENSTWSGVAILGVDLRERGLWGQ